MNTDDLLLSDGGTNAGPGKKTDKKRGGRKTWTTETKTEEEIKTEAEAVPETEARTEAEAVSETEARTEAEAVSETETRTDTEAEAVSETETRTDTEAEADSKNEKKTNSEEKFSVLSLKEEKLRDKRLNKICRLADRVVDRLTGAVEELETTDTQRFRQIVASIKEIKDIQMLDSPDERLEKQIKLKNLERQMLEAEAENVSGSGEILVRIEGDEGYSE